MMLSTRKWRWGDCRLIWRKEADGGGSLPSDTRAISPGVWRLARLWGCCTVTRARFHTSNGGTLRASGSSQPSARGNWPGGSASWCAGATAGGWSVGPWWGLGRGGDGWRLVGWPLVPIVLIAWLSDRGERLAWPVARHFESYLFHGAVVLAGFVWLWMVHANVDSRGG